MKKISYPEQYLKNKIKFWHDVSDTSWNNWKWQIANQVNTPEKLVKFFPNLNSDDLNKISTAYPFSITPHFLSLINISDDNDPVFKQIIPDIKELKKERGLKLDPFGEREKSPAEHVIKRYNDRAIIVTTNLCASLCRYCTRKWMWNNNFVLNDKNIKEIKNYLKKTPLIREVIISGGEPFMLPSDLMDRLLSEIFSIDHIQMIRIGTRILSFLPQKIDNATVKILSRYKPLWIITHFNHPSEITAGTVDAAEKLIETGAVLCNQSVLLKGINDDEKILKELYYTLTRIRIKPYYLFQCDPVLGTGHFHTPLRKGALLMKKLSSSIGGLCIPQYVIDTKGKGKIPVLHQQSGNGKKSKLVNSRNTSL